MPTVTLLTKVFGGLRSKDLDENLRVMLEGLKVVAETRAATSRGWMQVTITGEDENVALNYLEQRIGLCPSSLENVARFSTITGRVKSLKESNNELLVDIGVFSPKIFDAAIPLSRLRAQLVDGERLSLDKIVWLFGLCENLPLTVKIERLDEERSLFKAEVAEDQMRRYAEWTGSLLDRLLILGAPLGRVKHALEQAGLNRDVVEVEQLGAFDFEAVCKMGTDAVGLIQKTGRNLGNAALAVFSPRRVLPFFQFRSTPPASQ